MQIGDVLAQTGGLQAMARELGISEAEAARGASALAPAVLGGFKKQVQSQPQGLGGLGGLLGQLGGGELLDDLVAPKPTDVNRGNEVLGRVFGSKDVSRAVAQNASQQTGLDTGLLKKMLPMVAMLVSGYLAKQAGGGGAAGASPAGGGLGGLLGGLLGGSASGAGVAKQGGGPGGLGSMLDFDGDGNPLDDILRAISKG